MLPLTNASYLGNLEVQRGVEIQTASRSGLFQNRNRREPGIPLLCDNRRIRMEGEVADMRAAATVVAEFVRGLGVVRVAR